MNLSIPSAARQCSWCPLVGERGAYGQGEACKLRSNPRCFGEGMPQIPAGRDNVRFVESRWQDIVVAHSAGVGKARQGLSISCQLYIQVGCCYGCSACGVESFAQAVTLATTGVWTGPLLLLAGGNGCAPVSDMTGQT